MARRQMNLDHSVMIDHQAKDKFVPICRKLIVYNLFEPNESADIKTCTIGLKLSLAK